MLFIRKFLHDQDGATAIEYALIAGLISVSIVVVAGTVGDNLTSLFSNIGQAVADALGGN